MFLGLPTVALILLASLWVPWTVPGFPAHQVLEAVGIARVALAASLAGVYALVLAARMQANSEFALNALAAVLAAGAAMWNLADLLIRCTEHPAAPGQTLLAANAEDVALPELIRTLAEGMGKRARLYMSRRSCRDWARAL